MWECPNLDKLENKYLFIISSEGWFNEKDKYELNNSRNVVYTSIEKLDFENKTINEDYKMKTMDFGHDFYAPQTFVVNNKLALIAWLGAVDVQYPTDRYSWHSILTIPRELSWNNEVLVQKPLKEFCDNVIYNTQKLKTNKVQAKFSKHLKFNLDSNSKMKIVNEEKEEISLTFTEEEICFDRTNQGEKVDWNYETPRYAKRKLKNQIIEIFIDSSSIEIFADDYSTIFTSRFFVKNWNEINFDKEIEIEVSDIREIKEF
ncbi:GH32 C-terminal domain-containing protein [Spiroplasma taiwanense]|uniref:GH32 C-terminal domain-containing protein n=1 Tax=Spiroplasma taiwanense TaxID=2145 RepID=UPI00041C31CE|nr:GH32 C-terminal domain-containing protein [Spiroplasma taiwanense]